MSVTSPPLSELQIASLRLLVKFGWGRDEWADSEEANRIVVSTLGLRAEATYAEAMAMLPNVSRETAGTA